MQTQYTGLDPEESDQLDSLDASGQPFDATVGAGGQLTVNKLPKPKTIDLKTQFNWKAALAEGYSNQQILDNLNKMGVLPFDYNDAKKQGFTADAIADYYNPPKKPDESFLGATGRGLKEAFQQIPQLGYGLVAGAGAALESAAGEGGIGSAVKNYGVKNYKEASDKIEAQSQDADSIDYSWDEAKKGNLGALTHWFAHGLGYTVGQGVQAVATGGIGAFVAKSGAKFVAKEVIGGMVTKETARILELQAADTAAATAAGQTVKALTADELGQIAVKNVASKIGNMGTTAAIAGNAFGMEGGEIFGDLSEESVKRGTALTGMELAKATGATLAAGGLEFVGDKLGLDLILGKSPLLGAFKNAKGLPGRVGGAVVAAAAAAPIEGATEYFQTGLEEYGKGKEQNILPFNQSLDAQKQAREAAALGVLGGVVMGGAGGAAHRPQIVPDAAPPPVLPPTASRIERTGDFKADVAAINSAPITPINIGDKFAALKTGFSTAQVNQDSTGNQADQTGTGQIAQVNQAPAVTPISTDNVGLGVLPTNTGQMVESNTAQTKAASTDRLTEDRRATDDTQVTQGGENSFKQGDISASNGTFFTTAAAAQTFANNNSINGEPVRYVSNNSTIGYGIRPTEQSRFATPDDIAISDNLAKSKKLGVDPEVGKQFLKMPERDDVTGFYDGQKSGAKSNVVRRAQEHVQATGESAFYVDADIHNLGGLNDAVNNVPHVANAHYNAIANIMKGEFEAAGAQVIPMRTGGDEIGAVVINATPEIIKATNIKIRQKVSEYVKAQGLQDIPHPKGKSPGLGLYLGHSEILPNKSLSDIFTEASIGVDRGKNESRTAGQAAGAGRTIAQGAGNEVAANGASTRQSQSGGSGQAGSIAKGEVNVSSDGTGNAASDKTGATQLPANTDTNGSGSQSGGSTGYVAFAKEGEQPRSFATKKAALTYAKANKVDSTHSVIQQGQRWIVAKENNGTERNNGNSDQSTGGSANDTQRSTAGTDGNLSTRESVSTGLGQKPNSGTTSQTDNAATTRQASNESPEQSAVQPGPENTASDSQLQQDGGSKGAEALSNGSPLDSIPPMFLADTEVTARVFDEDTGKYTKEKVSAEEALTATRADIETMRALRACVGA